MKMMLAGDKVTEHEAALENAIACPDLGLTADQVRELGGKIMVALPHVENSDINPSFFELSPQWALCRITSNRMMVPHTGFVDIARAAMCRRFLELKQTYPELEYFVMIDTDQQVPWDAPLKLAAWGKPIVSGVVCSPHPRLVAYACFMVKDRNGKARFPSVSSTKWLPNQGLMKVHRVGSGLVCIRHDVLEAIFDSGDIPFYLPEEVRRKSCQGGVIKKGEDIWFCEQAEKLGFESYVDLSVHAKHFKRVPIGWPPLLLKDTPASAWRVDDNDYSGPDEE